MKKRKLQIKVNLHIFCIEGDCISVVKAYLDSEKCFTSAEVSYINVNEAGCCSCTVNILTFLTCIH